MKKDTKKLRIKRESIHRMTDLLQNPTLRVGGGITDLTFCYVCRTRTPENGCTEFCY